MPLSQRVAGFRAPYYHSLDTGNSGSHSGAGTLAVATYPTANLAIYHPVRVRYPVLVRKLSVSAGGIGTGTFDMGIYNAAGTRIVSTGSQSKAATSQEQVVDITDTLIGPGLFYLAVVASNITDNYWSIAPGAPLPAAWGVLTEQLGSAVLGSTASWTVDSTLNYYVLLSALLETTVA